MGHSSIDKPPAEMRDPSEPDDELSVTKAWRLAEEYLRELQAEENRRVEAYLDRLTDPAERNEFLHLALKGEYLQQVAQGESPDAAEYLSFFDSEEDRAKFRAGAYAEEYLWHLEDDDPPDPVDYLDRLHSEAEKQQFHRLVDDAQAAIKRLPWNIEHGGLLGSKYRILSQIGGGGYGVVYSAIDRDLERRVAIKALKIQSLESQPSLASDLIEESRILARLRSPNIVGIHDILRQGENVYVILDHIEGTDLHEALSSLRDRYGDHFHTELGEEARVEALRKALGTNAVAGDSPIEEKSWYRTVASIVHRMAHTVERAHDQKILHRDLKPHNIMLRPDGDPVLLDFGIGYRMNSVSRADDNRFQGTLEYLAPEQIENMQTGADPRTDVYQLGLILYEFLGLERAFKRREGEEVTALLFRISQREHAQLAEIDPKVPPSLLAICRKAMAADPNARYEAMRDLREDLERYLQGLPPRSAQLPAAQALALRVKHALENRARVAAVVAVLAVVAAVLGPMLWDWMVWNPPQTSIIRIRGDKLEVIGKEAEVQRGDTLGLRVNGDDKSYIYAINIFGGEGDEDSYVEAAGICRLTDQADSSDPGLWVDEGTIDIIVNALSTEDADDSSRFEYEGFIAYICEGSDPVLDEWFREIDEGGHPDDLRTEDGMTLSYAKSRLQELGMRTRGESPSKLSPEEFERRYGGIVSLEGEEVRNGMKIVKHRSKVAQ